MCNRVGVEDNMTFFGESMVVDYNGEIVDIAGSDEELLLCDINMSNVIDVRNKKPYASLRRTELYL